MGRVNPGVLFAAIMLLTPTAEVLAADYTAPVSIGGTWYLRGDIGFKLYGPPEATFNAPTFGPGYSVPGNGELFSETMSGSFLIGGGVGYDFAGPMRIDVTIDYETPGHYRGQLDCPLCGATYSVETADISSWTGLINFYHEFGGGVHGFMPYVGAGIGLSLLSTSNVESSDPPGTHAGDQKWNFAWALMAGVARQMSVGWIFDAGYRYLHLGEAQSGLIDDGLGNTGRLRYLNIAAHEFRIGVRHPLH